jgi:hypothetical protein
MKKDINWNASRDEMLLIIKIAYRAKRLLPSRDLLGSTMDITACHLNGCPLKLEDLFKSDEENFLHDVCGISRHINRRTGKLLHCFLPRFSK